MARKARSEILYDRSYAHVFSRSIEKRKIFKQSNDFEEFRRLLLQQKKEKLFNIFHYCLMQTHFHMAVGVGFLGQFSKALQALKWKYTRYYNAKYKRWGPLWRERFGSMLIEDEQYLYACGKYIEQNPVKAGIVDSGEKWAYSSAKHYAGVHLDEMIDEYEGAVLPSGIDLNDHGMFTKGYAIGSGWFKYKRQKGIA